MKDNMIYYILRVYMEDQEYIHARLALALYYAENIAPDMMDYNTHKELLPYIEKADRPNTNDAEEVLGLINILYKAYPEYVSSFLHKMFNELLKPAKLFDEFMPYNWKLKAKKYKYKITGEYPNRNIWIYKDDGDVDCFPIYCMYDLN